MSDSDNSDTIGLRSLVDKVADRWEEKVARGRGIYTDTDRKFLWGIKEYDDPPPRSRRRESIRERTIEGIRDFFYLPLIESDQQKRIVDKLQQREPYVGDFQVAVSNLIRFAYKNMDYDEEWVAKCVEIGIQRAEDDRANKERYGGGVDVSISVNEGYDLQRLERQLNGEQPHNLTAEEVGALAKSGRLSAEDLEELESDFWKLPTFQEPD